MKEKDYLMNNKIFIGIPCWRDPFLINTINSAISNAKYPEDLVFGVVFQGYDEDNYILEDLKKIDATIRLIKINADEAPIFLTKIKGEITTSLMQNEKYYMQIDSHTKFRHHWDVGMKAELLLSTQKFGKTVLSPPAAYFEKWSEEVSEMNYTVIPNEQQFVDLGKWFSFDDFPLAVYGSIFDKPNNMLIHEKFYNGNCIFAYSDYVKDVPQPNNHTINYEQQIMALRIFTAGYYLVSTIQPYTNCFNYWTTNPEADKFVRHVRSKDPIWKNKFIEADLESRNAYLDVLKNKIIDKQSGMLEARTYDEYVSFLGYDPITLKLTRKAKMLENNFVFVTDEEFEAALDIVEQDRLIHKNQK